MVVSIAIGKNGLTEGVLNEILKVFKRHGCVSVKLLKNYRQWKDRDELAADLLFIRSFIEAHLGRHILMSRTGYTALYARSRRLLRQNFRKNTPHTPHRPLPLTPRREDKPFKQSSNPPVRDDENMTG